MKVSATTMPSGRRHLDAERLEMAPDPTVAGVERGQRDAGDGGRHKANGRSTSESTRRLPESGSAPAPQATMSPKKALIDAASRDAPKVTRYEASARSPLAISQNCAKFSRHRS